MSDMLESAVLVAAAFGILLWAKVCIGEVTN